MDARKDPMKARTLFAVAAVALLGVSPAPASIISASAQMQPDRQAALRTDVGATSLQNDINAALRTTVNATAASAFTGGGSVTRTGGVALSGGGTTHLGPTTDPAMPLFDPVNGGISKYAGHGSRARTGEGRPGGTSGIQAAPEPSTFLLLGASLAALGGGLLLRRRVLA